MHLKNKKKLTFLWVPSSPPHQVNLCSTKDFTTEESASLPTEQWLSGSSSVQSLSHVRLLATPWTTACWRSLSITNSWSLLKLMSVESVMPCHPTISSSVTPFSSCSQSFPASGSFPMSQFFASDGPSIGASALASVLPMNIQDSCPLGRTDWISLQSKGLLRVFSNTTVQKHQFFGAQLSSQSNSHIQTWLLEKPQLWLDGPLLAK